MKLCICHFHMDLFFFSISVGNIFKEKYPRGIWRIAGLTGKDYDVCLFLYWHDVSIHCISVFISYIRHNMYMCVCAYDLCVCMQLHIYMEGVGWLKTNMEGIWSWATCGTEWNCKSSHTEIFWICFENSNIHNKRDTEKNKSWICKQEHRFLSSERGTAVGSWVNSAVEHLKLNVKGTVTGGNDGSDVSETFRNLDKLYVWKSVG